MDNQNQTNQQSSASSSTQNLPISPITPGHVDTTDPLSKTDKFKRIFYQILIGCLLASAAIAVVAVLAGGFNHTLGRALATIAMVALHSLLSFGYISETEKQDKKDGGRSTEFFSNTVFTLIVISFMTSIFAIWQVLDGSITLRLYASYGVLLFAILHADVLYRIRSFEKRIDSVVASNYFFMAIVVAMLFVIIFSGSPSDLGAFYYRVLAASAIIDATMTITAIIMHKMYLQKHPRLAAEAAHATAAPKNFWRNPLVVLLLIFLAAQVIGTLIGLLAHGF